MAVTVATSYADSTAISASSTAAEIMTVEVMANPSNTATMFIQFFDAAAATLGADIPILTMPIRPFAIQGAQTMQKMALHLGVRATTGLSFFVTNTYAVNTTAASGVNAPQQVRVFWNPS